MKAIRRNAYDYRKPQCRACAAKWEQSLKTTGRAKDGRVYYEPCPLHAPTERRAPSVAQRMRDAEEHWRRVDRGERPGFPLDEIPPIENPPERLENLLGELNDDIGDERLWIKLITLANSLGWQVNIRSSSSDAVGTDVRFVDWTFPFIDSRGRVSFLSIEFIHPDTIVYLEPEGGA